MNGSGNGVKIENEKINMFFVVFLLALFCCAFCLFKLRMKKMNVFLSFCLPEGEKVVQLS